MSAKVPNPVRIFHITAVGNLTAIFKAGALVAKNAGQKYTNIAHAGAQGSRSARAVPNPPGGVIHDYVPFYYAPRSPMLSSIHNGNVQGCALGQKDIVHFEFSVNSALEDGAPFVIYDRNATLQYAKPYTRLEDLDKIAWELFFESPTKDGFCVYFFDRPADPKRADRRERRMAEFLVKDRVGLNRCSCIGVFDDHVRRAVVQQMREQNIDLPVDVKPDWYF